MLSKITHFRKGVRNAAKAELLSPLEKYKKTKEYQTLPGEATPTT